LVFLYSLSIEILEEVAPTETVEFIQKEGCRIDGRENEQHRRVIKHSGRSEVIISEGVVSTAPYSVSVELEGGTLVVGQAGYKSLGSNYDIF